MTRERDFRDEAVTNVDGRHGYTIEFASDRASHSAEYDDEELRLRRQAGYEFDEFNRRWQQISALINLP